MNKDFELFQREFLKWQKLFGVTGYKVYFEEADTEDAYADITVDGPIATVRLNNKLSEEGKWVIDVKQSAKHEAIHLLIQRLEQNARYRYSTSGEITEAAEELVYRLEELIPG